MHTAALISAIVAGLIPSAVTAPALEFLEANTVDKLGNELTSGNHYGAPSPPWQHNSKPGWYYGSHPGKNPGAPILTPYTCQGLENYPQAIHCPHNYPPHHPPSTHYPPHTTKEYTTKTTPSQLPQSSHSSDTPVVPVYTQPGYSMAATQVYATPVYTTTSVSQETPAPTYYLPPSSYSTYYPTFSNITAAVQADDYMTFGLVDTVDDCRAMCDSVEGCDFVNTYHDVHGKDGSPLLTCSLFSFCHGPEDADNRGGQTQPDGSINFILNSDGWCKQ